MRVPPLSRFNYRANLCEPAEAVQDDMGGLPPAAPTVLATLWVALEPLDADSRERAAQTGVVATHRIWTRVAGVSLRSGMMLVIGDRNLVIHSWVDVEERNRFWAVDVEEVR